VVKFNAHGPEGLVNRKPPGQPSKLSAPRRRGLPVEEGSTQRDVGCAGS
jgi:hypothetical protein